MGLCVWLLQQSSDVVFCCKGHRCVCLFFFLQSTINPVDGIYQPPLDTPAVNTMPTQTTLPPGTSASPTCARHLKVTAVTYCVETCWEVVGVIYLKVTAAPPVVGIGIAEPLEKCVKSVDVLSLDDIWNYVSAATGNMFWCDSTITSIDKYS